MAEFYQEILKWLDTMSGLMRALPVTQTNADAMAKMYTTMFNMVQTFVERLPISGAASAVAPVPAKAPTALPELPPAPLSIRRPFEIVREAAAMPLPDEPAAPLPADMDIRPVPTLVRRAENAPLPETAPAGAAEEPAGEEAEAAAEEPAERPTTNKISLRLHGYRMSGKNTTRFAALERARAAHGTGTVLHRLELLEHIWKTCDHARASEFRQNILADIAYLREMDRRAARRSDE